MVAVKARLSSLKDRVTQDQKMSNTGQVKNFKIYVEPEKVKDLDSLNNRTKGKPIPPSIGCYLLSGNEKKNTIKNLGKSKIKLEKSVNANAGRKVLADIGNVKCSFPTTEERKSSRPGKDKKEMMSVRGSHKDAVDVGTLNGASSSDKHSRDSMRLHQIQATVDNQTSKKPVNKQIKAKSDEMMTKFEDRSSAAATGRKISRIPLHLTRKSLPVLKQTIQVETSGASKDKSEKSDILRGKHGFPVKRSTVSSSRPMVNRVSDGFVLMESRAQTKVGAPGVLSRKSVKPTVKTTVTSRRNSKSGHILTTKNPMSKATDLSERKQNKASTSENIHEEPDSDDISSGTVIARRKSDRRNSFTCSLMSRSKLISKVFSQKALPDIYDDRNHLEVFEYVDDIYQYYWVMEGQNPLLKNYMENQRDITPQMRGILINWLVEVHLKFDLMEETLFLTVTLLDRYLSLESIKKNEMQLAGLTALLLASKYEDFWHPRVTDLVSISAESYSRAQMLSMEKAILKKLKFRLNEPTPYVFMLRFLKAARSDIKFEHLAFYLIELCLVEYEALNYKPSLLCASAIYVAQCTLKMTPPWTPLLAKHTRYEESKIRDCAGMILKFQKAAKTSLLKVSYEKYSKLDYSRVATIKPLDKLPA